MRFTEIANPEDQLALWKLISDKMWAAFAQPVPKMPNVQALPVQAQQSRSTTPVKPSARPTQNVTRKSSLKGRPKALKPKRAPMAPAPKPLPKPKPQQVTPSQSVKNQTQQHKQIAQQLHKELIKPHCSKKSTPNHQPPPRNYQPLRYP
jgi:hypothetical protein